MSIMCSDGTKIWISPFSFTWCLRDREVACSASDRQGSNFESCVWRTVSSQSSHHPQEVLLAQFSLYVHKGGLKPDSFHYFHVVFSPVRLGCGLSSVDIRKPAGRRWRNVDLMLGHRRIRWPNIKPTLSQCILLADTSPISGGHISCLPARPTDRVTVRCSMPLDRMLRSLNVREHLSLTFQLRCWSHQKK